MGILDQFVQAPVDPPASADAVPEQSFGNQGPILDRFTPTIEEQTGVDQPDTLGEEFQAGLSMGGNQLQATFAGFTRLLGRELGMTDLEGWAAQAVESNLDEAAAFAPTMAAFSDVEDMEGFFQWAAGGLGQVLPSMSLAIGSGGIGGIASRKLVERQIHDTVRSRMVRNMTRRGIGSETAERAADRALRSQAGFQMVRDGMTRGMQNTVLRNRGFTRGAMAGSFAGSATPQIGEADIALQEKGIDAGFSAVLAGTAGGLLEMAPAVRALTRLFPGVDTRLAGNFVQDFAKGMAIQGVLEGGTEGMQEVIQMAALAYHDPNFDMMDPENLTQVGDSFALGALAGVVTGGLAEVGGGLSTNIQERRNAMLTKPDIPAFDIGEVTAQEIQDDDFVPADNTVFEEVRGRVNQVVREDINPAVNGIRESLMTGLDRVMDAMPSVRSLAGRFTDRVQGAHNQFLENHEPVLNDVKRFAREQVAYITQQAQEIADPKARREFVERSVKDVKAHVQQVAQQLRDRATRVSRQMEQEVSDVGVFDDEFTSPNVETETDFQFGKEGSRGEQVRGWKSRKGARRELERLRTKYPSATESTFGIRQLDDGSYIVALEDSGQRDFLIEDEIVSNSIENARKSARQNPNRGRQAQVQMKGVAGKTFLDVPTLVLAGRQLDNGDNQTIEQGFATIVGRLLDRGIIGDDGFVALQQRFNELYPSGKRKFAIRRALEEITPEQRQEALDEEFQTQDEITRGIERDESGEVIRSREEMGEEQRLIEEGQGRNLETEAQQARAQSSASRAKPKQTKKRKKPKPVTKVAPKEKVTIMMPGVARRLQNATKEIVERAANLLSDNAKVVVMTQSAIRSVEQTDPMYQAINSLEGRKFAVVRVGDTYIVAVDENADPGMYIAATAHELGHAIHFDTWEQLSQKEQNEIYEAFKADIESGRRTTGARVKRTAEDQRVFDQAEENMFEFREWAADQFVDWMSNRRQPTTAMEKFLEAVGAKLDQLWEFISNNPGRFNQLNDTYADFLDAVALRVRNGDGTGNGRWFKGDGQPGRPYRALWDKQQLKRTGPPGVIQQEWARIAKAVERDYPLVAARARATYEFMHRAYHLAVAPSTSVMRDLSKKGITAADDLAMFFNRREHGKAKQTRNYHQMLKLQRGRFQERYRRIFGSLTDEQKVQIAIRLRQHEQTGNVKLTLREQQLRKLFDDMHNYAREVGLPVGRIENYFPKMFDRELLLENQDKIIAFLAAEHTKRRPKDGPVEAMSRAKSFFNSLISDEAAAASAQRELALDPMTLQSPSFRNMRSRTMDENTEFWNQFLDNNLDSVVFNYINGLTKRGEYNRLLGEKVKDGIVGGDRLTKTMYNPHARLEKILRKAKEQGASKDELKLMKQYVDANIGMLGRDSISPGVRSAMATLVAYQNMRLLLFTVFASLPDVVGPAIRAGDLKLAYRAAMDNIKEIAKDEGQLADMARSWGIVSDTMNQHIMTEYVDNHYMPPTVRKWNDAFFKYTGLNYYTDFTRKMALAVGRDSIKNEAAKVNNPAYSEKQRNRAKQFLAELGLTADMVKTWVDRGEPTWEGTGYENESAVDQRIAEALLQFVDESIMSPNASQRPIMASHPGAMLVFHLKGYIYAIYDTVIKRLAHNFRTSDTEFQLLTKAGIPVIMMIALSALGLELRELVTGSNRTDRMDGWEYTWEAIDRSGLLALTQFAFDFQDAGARGQSEFAALSGPTLQQFGDLLSKPSSQTIPKAIPVVSQLPWARDALREATPL